MTRPLIATLATLAALLVAPMGARAEPMFTPYDEVIDTSTDVVIARFIGPVGTTNPLMASHYELEVERALRGSLRGTIRVTPGDGHASFPRGTRIVAFLRNSSFRFVGVATEGRRLEDGGRVTRPVPH